MIQLLLLTIMSMNVGNGVSRPTCARNSLTVLVVVGIFYLQHMILYGKDAVKRSTRKKSHRRDFSYFHSGLYIFK